MAGKPVIKINSNPNTTPVKSMTSPAKTAAAEWKANDAARKAHYNLSEHDSTHDVIKVRSSGLTGRPVGNMDHMGGHAPIAGTPGMDLGGGGLHESMR